MAKNIQAIRDFTALLYWVESIKDLDESILTRPMKEGKWSIKEVLCHIWFWDQYSLETMVPQMKEGAKLSFVDIQKLNDQAGDYAAQFDLPHIIEQFITTRNQLIEKWVQVWDEELTFFISNQPYNQEKYLSIFIEHDLHHFKQMDNYLSKHKLR